MQTPTTAEVINKTVEEIQGIVSSGNQTETNLQRVSMQLNSIAEVIEDVTVNKAVSWQTSSSYNIFTCPYDTDSGLSFRCCGWALRGVVRRSAAELSKLFPSVRLSKSLQSRSINKHLPRILEVVERIGSSLLAQLKEITSCQDGLFLLARRVCSLQIMFTCSYWCIHRLTRAMWLISI